MVPALPLNDVPSPGSGPIMCFAGSGGKEQAALEDHTAMWLAVMRHKPGCCG